MSNLQAHTSPVPSLAPQHPWPARATLVELVHTPASQVCAGWYVVPVAVFWREAFQDAGHARRHHTGRDMGSFKAQQAPPVRLNTFERLEHEAGGALGVPVGRLGICNRGVLWAA